jgi:hypothetical protein
MQQKYIDSKLTHENGFDYLRAIASGATPPPVLSSDIRFWSHEPHEPLIGKIVGFGEFDHTAYGHQKTVIVEREDGEVVSAILTNYLQRGMEIQNGEIGDLVLIEKQGQERSKCGKTFNRFQFVVQKQLK